MYLFFSLEKKENQETEKLERLKKLTELISSRLFTTIFYTLDNFVYFVLYTLQSITPLQHIS